MASYPLNDKVALNEINGNSIAEKCMSNVVLVGGSNCRGIDFKDDDQLNTQERPLIQECLLIAKASEKLDQCSQKIRNETDVVTVHVGSCIFSANYYANIDKHYIHYAERLNSIS